jgi:DNA-binding transcriptional LysR family regulator
MKDLNEIMVFTAVANLGSFSGAAKNLNMPVSTVSRKVSDLETRLGITLIQRTTRKLNLTPAGARYFEQCADLLQGLDEAEVEATQLQTQAEGFLRVSVPIGMVTERFMNFISRFLQRHPRIDLDLLVTNEYVDLVREGVDLAIRFGPLQDSSLIAKRVGTTSRVLVASPEYIKKHGKLKHPEDLKKHRCLIYRLRHLESLWELTKDKAKKQIHVRGSFSASDMLALLELTIRHHGIALLPDMLCLDALEDGRLVQLLPEWKAPTSPAHAVYLNRRFLPARLNSFMKELENWEDPSWRR